jgi:hypothetical protein
MQAIIEVTEIRVGRSGRILRAGKDFTFEPRTGVYTFPRKTPKSTVVTYVYRNNPHNTTSGAGGSVEGRREKSRKASTRRRRRPQMTGLQNVSSSQ